MPDALAACRAIANDSQRLACYDSLARSTTVIAPATPGKAAVVSSPPAAPSVPAASPAPATAAATPGSPAASPATAVAPVAGIEQGFGSETVVKLPAPDAAKTMNAHLSDSIDGITRGAIFHLDNGQTWRNIDDREYDYEGDHPAVSIERNFAGTYWMRLEHAPFNLRVTRVE
ncbi:MAG TPA: hypothetical protein VNX47_12830 [Nevskia sp.]|nr:hypothetical protein [Nevskia sp.]